MKSLIIILFIPIIGFSQKSIQKHDIEISTQLTLLSIDSADVLEFENNMNSLSRLAQKSQLKEEYDWLLYKSDSDQYLIVNFSNGFEDALTLEDYRTEFNNQKVGAEFEKAIGSIKRLNISLDKNYVKQMLLPWSTVEHISVSQFPLAKMVEYQIRTSKIDTFDSELRKLIKILKETDYPYPLEGNRGSLGAYGTMTLVWFFDNKIDYEGKNNIVDWMIKRKRNVEFQSILDKINEITESSKTHNLTYKKELSY